MKLLFCPACKDVIVLHLSGPDRDRDACQCGKTTGFYCSQERAVHNGHGVPLMIDNQDLLREADNYLGDPNRQIERPIKAAIIPRQCQTLVVKEQPTTENNE